VALTEHRPELSWAHCTGLRLLRPGKAPAEAYRGRFHPKGVPHRKLGEVRRVQRSNDLDQFKEPLAAPVPAPEVDPLECCASSDPLELPEAV
jgi:hypothetical protein